MKKNEFSDVNIFYFFILCVQVSLETGEKCQIVFSKFCYQKIKLGDGFMNETDIKS